MPHSLFQPTACAILALALIYSSAAQDSPGQALVAAHDPNFGSGALLVVDATQQSVLPVTGLPSELARPFAVADDPYRDDVFFVGTDGRTPTGIVGTNVFAVTLRAGRFVSRTLLTPQPLAEETIVDLELVGNRLVVLGRQSLLFLPVGGGPPTTLIQFTGTNEGRAMASDGRHAYVAINNRDIVRIDLFAPVSAPVWTRVPGGFINAILDLHIAAESLFVGTGDPLLGGEVLRYDLGTAMRTLRAAAGLSAVGAIGGDDRTDSLVVAGPTGGSDRLKTFTRGTFSASFGAINLDVVAVTVNRTRRLMRFGQPCSDSRGTEPRIGSSSSPSLGNSRFAIEVTTQAGVFAILAGQDRFNPWRIPVATDLTRFGAPGCTLLLLPVATAAAFTNGQGLGMVTLPIPNQPQLLGGMMDFQWAVLDPAANRLGMAFSQAGTVVVTN